MYLYVLCLITIHRWLIMLHVVYFYCQKLSFSQDVREADFYFIMLYSNAFMFNAICNSFAVHSCV